METPDLITFHVLHRGMRKDAARLAAAVDSLREAERTIRGPALQRWYAGYNGELHDHHDIEDTIFFPAILERLPVFDRSIARIDADHAALDDALARTQVALAEVADANVHWPTASAEASDAARELRLLLQSHLGFEDAEVLPLFVAHFGREEYEALEEQAKKQINVGQLKFTIPWAVDAATDDERKTMLDNSPFAFKLLWHATRRRYNRMAREAFGPAPTERKAA